MFLEKDTHPNECAGGCLLSKALRLKRGRRRRFHRHPWEDWALSAKTLDRKERGGQTRRTPRKSSLASGAGYSLGQQRSETPIDYRGFGQEMLAGSRPVTRCPWGFGENLKRRGRGEKPQRRRGYAFRNLQGATHWVRSSRRQCAFEKSASPTSTKRPLGFGNCGATASCSGFGWVFASGDSSFLAESACWAVGCSSGVAVRAQIP
jgi:hypothetical protein